MSQKYQNNDYREFLQNADSVESLDQLFNAFNGRGLEGTPSEGRIEGIVNHQYEIVKNNTIIVIDHINGKKVFISPTSEEIFNDILDRSIRNQCDGLDYTSWLEREYALNKED